MSFDAKITKYASQDIKFHQEDVWKQVQKIRGNIIIKFYPAKRATLPMLESHLQQSSMFGFKPDLVIVDYADELKGSLLYSKSEKRFELENIYEDLRGMAGELEIPVWTASQANRASLEDDVIEAHRIAESYNKIMIADFVMSLQRQTKDKLAHTGRVHVIKNRFGPDGWTFPSKLNAANGNIQLFNEASKDGKKASKDSAHGEVLERKMLKEKLEDLGFGKSKVEGMG